jgi:diguanylate cyclase (GGDEF)-like protein/PAS domain S-box-containing protein
MALAVSLLFVLFANAIAYVLLRQLEAERKQSISSGAFGLLSAVADSIDSKLALVHGALIRVAKTVPMRAMRDASAAQAFLDEQASLHALFDNGLFLIARDGKLIAESPFRPSRRGRDISYREFFQRTVQTQRPYISKPYRSTHDPGRPALIMTAPIFDPRGRMVGLIEGSFDLLGKNVLADLSTVKLGKKGYLYLADGRESIIAHPDPARIMKPAAKPGQNLLFDRAVEGFEGSGETVTSFGVGMLATFKRIRSTGWILGGNYPLEEAYAPIYTARRYVLGGMAGGTLLMLAAVWLLMRRLTAPLSTMAAQVQEIGRNPAARQRLEVASSDEIGTLAREFNQMLDEIERQQRDLARSEERFALAVKGSNDGLWDWDVASDAVYFSPRFRELLGQRGEQLPSAMSAFLGIIQPDDRARVQGVLQEHLRNGQPFDMEFRVLAAAGEERWFRARGQAVRDGSGRALRMAGALTDIQRQKAAEQQLWYMANYDPLTELPNRAFVREHLGHALAHAQRTGERVAVMFLDLDKFKEVNDTLGHTAGDELLCETSRRIATAVRREDWIARLGGDEFVVVVEGLTDAERATPVAQKILESVKRPFHIEGHEIVSPASIGITIFPDDGDKVDQLLRNADTAMYHAKARGGSDFQFFTPEMNAKAVRRFNLQAALRRAIEHEEFMIYYQPQMNARDGRLVGMEALLRWLDPRLGMISPGEFIPLAEDSGLIVPIGEWVLRTVCRQQRAWLDAGLSVVPVSVNFSARQFQRADLAEQIDRILDQCALEPGLLGVEITETVLMQNVEQAARVLHALGQRGLQVSLDDFGTGYSSLAYLKRFPLHTLKIDPSFVRGILHGADDRAICSAIVAMAHNLGLRVIAEGVETRPQQEALRALGCDVIQGFLLAVPAPAESVAGWLQGALRVSNGGG